MRAIRFWSLLAVAAGLATAACSDSGIPTESAPSATPSFSAAIHSRHCAGKPRTTAGAPGRCDSCAAWLAIGR